jgi:GT2 family glycosyltransferase
MSPDVSIIFVSHNDADDLAVSIPAALAQTGVAVEVIVVDNVSSDASREVADRHSREGVKRLALAENRGYAGGMNAGIGVSAGRYVLCLNPDCRLTPSFASVLAARLDQPGASGVGSASGKLLRAEGSELAATSIIDSAGIYRTASGRHFDRGSSQRDGRQFEREEGIFGVSGAAAFYRREALESVRISTGYFDEDFFLYREDADLAWRLQNALWRCLYVPDAVAYHRRRSLPERRREMSDLANYHSVKNRFLLRINNQTRAEFWQTLLPTLARDLLVFGACLTVERSSLPAFSWLFGNRRRLFAKRHEIEEKVRARALTARETRA